MKNFLSFFFPPKLEKEVVQAYRHRLPKGIRVSWKREDGFIVGEIFVKDGCDPIFTQALTPKEFVRMVNDAVFIAFDFKPEYIEFFHDKNIYSPTAADWSKLNDGKVPSASFGLQKILNGDFVPAAS